MRTEMVAPWRMVMVRWLSDKRDACAGLSVRARTGLVAVSISLGGALAAGAQDALVNAATPVEEQRWNWHVQNTEIVQGDPGFRAKYSGPNSLNSEGEVQETVTLDLYAGVRLWRGAEAHTDFLMWQGFGLSRTLGLEGFPKRGQLMVLEYC
jgi:high affinity Mn2+ porin